MPNILFDGQLFDAYEFIVNIIKRANKSIAIIDPYLDDKSLIYLLHKKAAL